MPFYLAWLCKKRTMYKDFFLFSTQLSKIFAPYVKNSDTYFAILIHFLFWSLWKQFLMDWIFWPFSHQSQNFSTLQKIKNEKQGQRQNSFQVWTFLKFCISLNFKEFCSLYSKALSWLAICIMFWILKKDLGRIVKLSNLFLLGRSKVIK